MYQLRYLSYLIVSVIGGCIFQAMIPSSNVIMNANWLMTGNILFEVLEWKYNIIEDEQDGI